MSIPGNTVNIMDPTIPIDQGIYEESSTQKARLGTRLVVGDRVFRYARLATSANVNAGTLLCCPDPVASHSDNICKASVQTAGANFITCSASAGNEFTANQYAEGYVAVGSTGLGGGGIMYRVKSHASGAAVPFYLYDNVATAVAAGPAGLIPCLYNKVLQGNAEAALGAGVAPVAVTTGNYFWCQTWGPAAVKCSASHAAGLILRVGVSGGAASVVAITELTVGGGPIGQNFNVAAVGSDACPVMLKINP
jgi:hypothetical protein